MDQKLINANVYQILQDLCKHCVQTKQEPQQVLSYFLDQKKKGFDFISFSYMLSKIFPNTSPFIQNCCFKFISEKYQSNIVTVQQIAELLQKIRTQTQESELQKPILSKIVNSKAPTLSSVNSSQKPQQLTQHRSVDQIIDIFMKNLVRVQINLIELFQKFDQNKDNYMNQEEFATMFSRVVKDLNDKEYSILINYFFRDSRELTAFQFKKLCENQQVNIMESNYYENPANANLLRSNIQFSELHVDNINLVAMQEFIQRYEQLKRDRQQYIDQSFPPNQQSLGALKFKNLQWKRISQFSREEPKFFVKENSVNRFGLGKWICPDDLLQGQLGDCYFLASISSLGNRRPDLLLDVFITRTYNPQGIYGVKLCVDGEWKVIGIDDHIPTLYDKPAFTRGKNSEIWVMVIEKAWAKLFNSYENIEAGYPTEVLHCLTGAPTRTIFTSDDDFIEQLEQCINLRCIMVCASKKAEKHNMKEMGLIPSHAYTVLKIKNLNANTRLIKLRNPWGKQEWKGEWSDQSPLWTPQLKQQFKISNVNDGIFYMNIPDFIKYFEDLSVSFVKENYKYQSLNLESNKKNSQYISITVQVDGFYFFTANQKNKRFENSFDYSPVKILLIQENEFLVGNFKETRECWVGQQLKKGTYIVVIKTLWKYGKTNKFVFSSYGPGQVQIQKIPKIQDLLYNVIIQQARKNKLLEGYTKNPAIQRGYAFFTGYGYGYIYAVNNSDQKFETIMTMTHFTGLKLRKPLRGTQIYIGLNPKEEFLAICSVQNTGYKFGMEEKFIIK